MPRCFHLLLFFAWLRGSDHVLVSLTRAGVRGPFVLLFAFAGSAFLIHASATDDRLPSRYTMRK